MKKMWLPPVVLILLLILTSIACGLPTGTGINAGVNDTGPVAGGGSGKSDVGVGLIIVAVVIVGFCIYVMWSITNSRRK